MARMLGRNRHYPCPAADCTRCRSCGDGNETRAFKRVEQRELARELAPETGIEWLASLEPALYDLSDCRHGCNGDCIVTGIGSDVCDFTCHPGLEHDEDKAARVAAALECWPGDTSVPSRRSARSRRWAG